MRETVRGLNSLINKLINIGGDSGEVLKRSIHESTEFIRDDARERCVEDSGDLRKSIDMDIKSDGKNIIGTVSTNMEYAPYIEFGTGKIGESTNTNTKQNLAYKQEGWTFFSEKLNQFVYTEGQPAKPFLYPALKENEKKIRNKLCQDVRREIKRIADD